MIGQALNTIVSLISNGNNSKGLKNKVKTLYPQIKEKVSHFNTKRLHHNYLKKKS